MSESLNNYICFSAGLENVFYKHSLKIWAKGAPNYPRLQCLNYSTTFCKMQGWNFPTSLQKLGNSQPLNHFFFQKIKIESHENKIHVLILTLT